MQGGRKVWEQGQGHRGRRRSNVEKLSADAGEGEMRCRDTGIGAGARASGG